MASLTKIALTTRRVVRYSIYAIIFLILARIIFGIGKSLYRGLFPQPPPPPTIGFDKLPSLPFPTTNQDLQIEYRVETVEGELPTLAEQAKVYFMPKPVQTHLNLETTQDKVAALGFDSSSPEKVSQTVYRFNHSKSPAVIEINIITGVFSISYNLETDPSPLSVLPPTAEVTASKARAFLSVADIFPDDLTGPTTHEFLKLEGRQLVRTLSLSEANLTKINLFRKSYDDLPSVTSKTANANVWLIMSGATQREKQVIAAEFHYFPVAEDNFETYPLKNAQTALEDLANNKGYIAEIDSTDLKQITIREVYLAYYDPGVQMEFYQPIIVFEGDNGFLAYVPAVTDEYYGE